jgi:hypothetical protein
MTLAGPWLLSAMSENGTPSARRFAMVVVLCLLAPLVLVGVLRWAPASIGECFIAWTLAACGSYVGGTWAGRGQVGTTTTDVSSSSRTTATTPNVPDSAGAIV